MLQLDVQIYRSLCCTWTFLRKPELHLDVSKRKKPLLLLDMNELQGPVLSPDVSRLQEHVLLLIRLHYRVL